MEKFNTAGMEVETMGGTDKSSVYVVFAEEKGLRLGMRGDIEVFGPAVGLFARVRCQKAKDWANLEDGPSIFNMPRLIDRSAKHKSFEAVILVARMPTTPYHVARIVRGNDLIGKMVDEILAMLPKKVKPLATREQLVLFLSSKLEDKLPDVEPEPIKEFVLMVGQDAISAGMDALIMQKPALKEPKKPSAPGEDKAAA
jgi:hypothetical protein